MSFAPEVRTRSANTAAALLVLGHKPIGLRREPVGYPTIRFSQSAEDDLRRLLGAKQRIEAYVEDHLKETQTEAAKDAAR